MLKETVSRKDAESAVRRWFSDDYFDLIVWIGEQDSITGFQLCYDKFHKERALTWTGKNGYKHERVDDGEANPSKNLAPILVPDGLCATGDLLQTFLTRSEEIDPDVRSFVADKLRGYSLTVK